MVGFETELCSNGGNPNLNAERQHDTLIRISDPRCSESARR